MNQAAFFIDNDRGYIPRFRGGAGSLALEMSSQDRELLLAPVAAHSETPTPATGILSRPSTRPPSSWTQTLPEIPYEDVISAHSINTFVPFDPNPRTTTPNGHGGFHGHSATRRSAYEPNPTPYPQVIRPRWAT
jgi:hypothetical protein